jgi:hypothetical protein
MARKAYTVVEANAMIARLEHVVVELRTLASGVEAIHEKLQVLELLWDDRVRDSLNPDHTEYEEHQNAIGTAAHAIEMLVEREIIARGIRLPAGGLEQGLLDFPTTWQGRWVYLCWRTGERRITAWHEVNGGFAGRKPLTADQARRMGLEDDPAHVDDSMLDF